MNMSICTAPN